MSTIAAPGRPRRRGGRSRDSASNLSLPNGIPSTFDAFPSVLGYLTGGMQALTREFDVPILDFKELNRFTPGEEFEGLVRELGVALGLRPEWTGRGADGGRDLTFTETREGTVSSHAVRWLVSCKDFAQSGRAVSEADVGTVLEKLRQHRLQGFLLVTTTTATTGLKAMLDGLREPGAVETQVWDRHELERRLLRDEHVDIVRRFMPKSFSAWKRLSNLSQTLEALDLLVPAALAGHIRILVETYQADDAWLTGSEIWPHDEASADTIDRAMKAFLEEGDAGRAAHVLGDGDIEFDAVDRLLATLAPVRREPTRSLCRELVKLRNGDGLSLFAYRFLADHYDLDNDEMIKLAAELGGEDLHELYADEISDLLGDALTSNPTAYRAWDDLDALSSSTLVEEAYAFSIALDGDAHAGRIAFRAEVRITATLVYDRESGPSMTFPGEAVGHVSANGIVLEEVTVDTSSFYE